MPVILDFIIAGFFILILYILLGLWVAYERIKEKNKCQ